jgi:hypothetical protein
MSQSKQRYSRSSGRSKMFTFVPINVYFIADRLCGLEVRVPGYRLEKYCVSCEVRTEFICYVEESRPPLWSSGQSSWLQDRDVLCFL